MASTSGTAAAPATSLIPPPTVIDDTHKVYSIAIICIVLGVVASLTVTCRLAQRIHARAFGADDYLIIPGLLCYMGWTIMAAYVNLNAGVGKPLWEITLGEYTVWFQGIIGSAWVYPAMTSCIRGSILFLYYRIFASQSFYFKVIIRILLALQVLYLIVFSITPGFICHPLDKAWTSILDREIYCSDWYYFNSIVALYSCSLAFDSILLFIPIYPIMKLHLPFRRRLGVTVILVLGAGASAVAAWKLAVFDTQMSRIDQINPRWLQYEMSRVIPPQFDKYGVTFWIPSQVESCVALIGTSLPALRHFFSERKEQLNSYYFERSTTTSSARGSSNRDGRHSSKGRFLNFTMDDEENPNESPYVELQDRCRH